MEVTIFVADEHLRGIPFARYETVLWNLVTETFFPDDCEIRPAAATLALVDGQWDTDDAREILTMAQDITTPDNVDGLFSRAEWVKLYGHLCDESVS